MPAARLTIPPYALKEPLVKKNLTLKTEHLTELGTEELAQAVGADYTGDAFCVLSYGKPCVTFLCTQNLACIVAD